MEALLKEFTKYLRANHKPESYYSQDQTPQIYIMSSVSVVFPQTKFITFCSQTQTGIPPWAFPLLKSICFLITRFSEAQSHSRLVSPTFWERFAYQFYVTNISYSWISLFHSRSHLPHSDLQDSSSMNSQWSSHPKPHCLYCNHPWHESIYISLSNINTLTASFLC